jgi:hypothetical protein
VTRELVFSAAGFAAGPVAGLGRGTALAPVLARLDLVPGVRRSSVDAAGRHFVLSLEPDADEVAVIAGAQSILRGAARRLEPRAAARQVAARVRGDPWFAADEVRALSYVEARILAARTAARLADDAELEPLEEEALGELVRSVVLRAVARVAGDGTQDWFQDAWPEIAREIREGSRGFLDPATHGRLCGALAARARAGSVIAGG